MRQKYDSSIVFFDATGNETLLPKVQSQIPYTTIFSLRKAGYSSYIENEFRCFF